MLELAVGIPLLLITMGAGWIVNSVILWLVLHSLVPVQGGAPFVKCFVAVLLMMLSMLPALLFKFVPVAGPVLFLLAWYWLSKRILERIFDMTSEGGTAFVIFLLVNALLHYAIRQIA